MPVFSNMQLRAIAVLQVMERRMRNRDLLSARTILIVFLLVAGTCGALLLRKIDEVQRQDRTLSQLTRFAICLEAWTLAHGTSPGPTLTDAIRAIPESPEDTRYLGSIVPMVFSGTDAWGRPFVYEVDAEKHYICIRSLGPNGKDDHGADDDIQVWAHW